MNFPYISNQADFPYNAPHQHAAPVTQNTENAFLELTIPSQPEYRPKRKRQLDFVKCGQCRKDKKKCTPSTRVWSHLTQQKCDRCREEGYECSEGSKKVRKSRERHTEEQVIPRSEHTFSVPEAPEPRAPVSEAPEPEVSEPEVSEAIMLFAKQLSFKDWSFLVGYRALLLHTTDRLQLLFRESVDKLNLSRLERRDFVAEAKEIEEILQLHTCCDMITLTIFQGATEVAISNAGKNSLRFAKLIALVASHGTFDDDDKFSDYTSVDSGNIAASFLLELKRENHCRLEPEEFLKLLELSTTIYTTSTRILGSMDQNAFPSFLPAGRFLPERLVVNHRHVSFDFLQLKDFLHRTALHRNLDDDDLCLDLSGYLIWGYLAEYNVNDIELREFINARDILGRTALHIACLKDDAYATQKLLDAGADTNLETRTGTLPIHYAAANKSFEICEMLLSSPGGCAIEVQDCIGFPAILYAIRGGNASIVRLMLKTGRLNPNLHSDSDYTPLVLATEMKNVDVVQLLLDNGADPNLATRFAPVLCSAVEGKNLPLVKAISKNERTDMNIEDVRTSVPRTALQIAIEGEFEDGVRYLINHPRVDVNYIGFADEGTPLEWAVRGGDLNIVKMLLEHKGVDLTCNGEDIASIARKCGHDEIYKMIVKEFGRRGMRNYG